MKKIDVAAHILPPRYAEAIYKYKHLVRTVLRPGSTAMQDLEIRSRMMDRFEGYVQILSILEPPVEDMAESPKVAAELAHLANDEMAELVIKYPEKFVGAIACLPMNDIDAVLKEVDRTIMELGFRGVQISSNIMDKPLDSPEFDPLFSKMNYYNLPIFIHPRYMQSGPRAFLREKTTDEVGNWAQWSFNWPFETTITMGRIVYSGMLDKYPNLKIITHHCGGLVPYQANRIRPRSELIPVNLNTGGRFNTKRVIDYYKMMYGDTAVWGNTAALMCGYAFFGADHMLFGTDMTKASHAGEDFAGLGRVYDTIRSVDEMKIPEEDKKKIFEDNARELFQMTVYIPWPTMITRQHRGGNTSRAFWNTRRF